MTPVGAARSLLLLLGVWWSWNDTAWFTNYFDPDRLPIQLVPVVLMLAGSPMSGSLPRAFGQSGLPAAASCGAIRVIRPTGWH